MRSAQSLCTMQSGFVRKRRSRHRLAFFFTATWLPCATSRRCTLPASGPASLSPPMLAMHARARHCPASSLASRSVLMAVTTVAMRSSGASAGCTISATAAYPTTFSLYLDDIISEMASMCPKSTS